MSIVFSKMQALNLASNYNLRKDSNYKTHKREDK